MDFNSAAAQKVVLRITKELVSNKICRGHFSDAAPDMNKPEVLKITTKSPYPFADVVVHTVIMDSAEEARLGQLALRKNVVSFYQAPPSLAAGW